MAARPLVVQQLDLDILEAQQLDMRELCKLCWQQIDKKFAWCHADCNITCEKNQIGSR